MLSPTIKLNTGAEIPLIGLGTWQSEPNEVEKAVEHALKIGYRHIDCAWCVQFPRCRNNGLIFIRAYDNEEEVGKGIKASGVPREEIFITRFVS